MTPWVNADSFLCLEDHEMVWDLFEELVKHFDDPEELGDFPPELKVLYHVAVLELEVNNGGFDQYVLNTELAYLEELRMGLKLLGLENTLELVTRAVNAEEDELGEIDDAYYEANGVEDANVVGALANYLRSNKAWTEFEHERLRA